MTGINFFVTILRCKTPTMKFMQMPMFTVTTFITTLIVILAFPVLTVALALMTTDRIFGTLLYSSRWRYANVMGKLLLGLGAP